MNQAERQKTEARTAACSCAVSLSRALSELQAAAPLNERFERCLEKLAEPSGGSLSVWRVDEGGDAELVAAHTAPGRDAQDALARMKEAALALWGRDPGRGKGIPGEGGKTPDGDAAAASAVAVATQDGMWGALARDGGESSGGQEILECAAGALALAVEGAQLRDEVALLRSGMAAMERDRAPEEKYATVGRLAFHSYREVVEILAGVETRLARAAAAGESSAGVLVSELSKARSLLEQQMEIARLEMPVLAMQDLNSLVSTALRESEDRINAKGIRLVKRLGSGIPRLLLDSEKISLALGRVLGAAVSRCPSEGWMRIETSYRQGEASVSVTWQEKSAPGEAGEDVLLPFGTLHDGGMGMILATQIIRQHGGGVYVKKYESGATALVMGFPADENRDRRRPGDRRSGVDRRRPSDGR